MNIKLYYIEGISMIDTPSFSISYSDFGSLLLQERYFNSKLVKTIESSFYPPYYKNKIKVDKDDFSLDEDSINYLSIQYCNKTYYYFINRIEYISENVLYLHITMDVIQTFYFNIKVENGIIERKCINRWNGSNINRPAPRTNALPTYIRENVSTGNFEQYTYHICNENSKHWFVIGSFNCKNINEVSYSVLAKAFVRAHVTSSYSSAYNYYSDNKALYFLPYGGALYSHDEVVSLINTETFLTKIAGCTYLDDVFIIPFNPFIGFNFDNNDILTITNTNYSDYTFYDNQPIYGDGSESTPTPPLTCFGAYQFSTCENSYSYSFPFIKNINKGIDFSYQYEPFLLDENYFKVEFGTSIINTDYPLHCLNDISIIGRYGCDITKGTRYFYLSHSLDKNDTYGTKVSDTNVLNLTIRNNRYNEYVATNKFRWLQALSTAGIQGIQQVMYGTMKAGSAGAILGAAEGLGTIGSAAINLKNTESNLLFSPKTIKQTQTFSDARLNYSIYIAMRLSRVNDIERVALYYHNQGYLVNEIIKPTSTIFGDVFNRYYFNVLKTRDINVHLINYIETDEITEKIKERLNDGIRLWNVRNNDVIIGDLHYDNVEYDYLQ